VANSFEIRFSGGDVHPSTVPAHELADLLNAAEQAVTSLAAQNFPDLDPSSVLVGLVGIRDASLGLEFASNRPDVVARAFRRLGSRVCFKANTESYCQSPGLQSFVSSFRSGYALTIRNWAAGPESASSIPLAQSPNPSDFTRLCSSR
jgi:hypothetical protein